MNPSDTIQTHIRRRQNQAAVWGVLSLILFVIVGVINATRGAGWQQFFRSYLLAYEFWITIPLGCLAILMVHHLTSGWWGLPIRRMLEAGTRTLWFMAALFIPVLIGMPNLYAWARPADVAADPILQYKHFYLNPTGFTVRAIIYFFLWLVMVYFLNKWSREQDLTGDPRTADRMETLSGPGLCVWGLVVSAAAVDWIMSLEPHWFSTIYGMIFMVVECLAAFSFVVFMLRMLSEYEPIRDSVEPRRYLDLGNLILTFTMLWAYLSFSQFLIIWSGNLKDEIPWYTQRAFGGWAPVAIILILLHFFAPFFLLLQRGVKRRLKTLSILAGGMVVMTFVDIWWLVSPSYDRLGPHFHILDVLAVIGIGGIWTSGFLWQLAKMPVLPLHDPRFEAILEHAHGD
ncbi:MAG: hypothetical protein ACRD4S_09120 [Candidatus Acidiferrales bacterium]